jgi:hypothetical protein
MPDMDLNHVFMYHPPGPIEQAKYTRLRDAAHVLAAEIQDAVPDCADRSAALRHLRECLFTANAAIALGGRL